MGYCVALLCCAMVLSLPGVQSQLTADLSLKRAFGDLIIRLRKWMKDNQEELRKGMGAIREHIANWGMMGPKMSHRNTDRTSNNIQPKPAVPPRPVFKPRPSTPNRRQRPTPPNRRQRPTPPNRRQWPTAPKMRQQIPRWKPRNRLSKSPYDPTYFLTHRRRIGRSVVPSQELERDYLSMKILSILAEIFTYAHSIDPSVKHPEKRKRDMLEEKRRDLDQMSTEDLKALANKLEHMDGVAADTQSNKLIVNGKEVDVKNIGSICCPFG